jgi:hypothetical protein
VAALRPEVAQPDPLEQLDQAEQHDGQQEEVDDHGEERAVADLGAVQRERELGEVGLAEDRRDELHDHVAGEAVHHGGERRTDDEAERQVEHVAAERERLELRPHRLHADPLGRTARMTATP